MDPLNTMCYLLATAVGILNSVDIPTDVGRRLRHRWQSDREQLHRMTPPLLTTSLKKNKIRKLFRFHRLRR